MHCFVIHIKIMLTKGMCKNIKLLTTIAIWLGSSFFSFYNLLSSIFTRRAQRVWGKELQNTL